MNEERLFELLERIAVALEGKKKERKKLPVNPNDGSEKLAILWNHYKHHSFPKIESITGASSRGKHANARWEERPSEDYWISVIKRINESRFCLGENDRGWKADFEFLVRPDNHARVLEGRFDSLHLNTKPKSNATKELELVGYLDGKPMYYPKK